MAIAYPLALALIALVLYVIGERWWPVLVALYLPPWGFALPLPLVLFASWRWGTRRGTWLQLVSVALVLFPLCGLVPRWPTTPPEAAASATADDTLAEAEPLRVFSQNIALGRIDLQLTFEEIARARPNVVVLQEARGAVVQRLLAHFQKWHTHAHDQFFLASRFPITATRIPLKLPARGVERSARFVQHTLATPLGPVELLNVHPISPRDGLDELRGEGFAHELQKGRLFDRRGPALIRQNAELRDQQIAAVAAAAPTDRPVVIAGDTNLPHQSRLLRVHLARFQDGFAVAGGGFGYTFPAHHPWLRIDRILASDDLRFASFVTGTAQGSDHLSVFAVLMRVAP
jgi:endonuclease/exonuclease/phosphatase family metal-dependent hydrolase